MSNPQVPLMKLSPYFASGRVVCPFARTADIRYFSDAALGDEVSFWATAIASGKVAVIYAAGEILRDFEQARQWCDETLVRVRELVGSSEYRPGTPFVKIKGAVAYVIGMGPQYPEDHPRYAPALCLVAVNEAQIREVSSEVRGTIWRAVLGRVGELYDPDQVWLPVESS